MRKFWVRSAVSLATVFSLALVVPVNAGAKTPEPTTIAEYIAAMHTYDHAVFVINDTLHQSIENDKDAEAAALNAATTEAQKYLARTDFYLARATDITNWQKALKNLGPPPTPPLIAGLPTLPITSSTTLIPLYRSATVRH